MSHEVERLVFLNQIGILEGILISLLFLIVFYSSIRVTRRLRSLKQRGLLVSLRALSFLLIVFIFLNPALRIETYQEEKKRIAFLIDYSWSMNLPAFREGVSRIQTVRDFFKNHKDFFGELEKNFLINYYVFDKSLKPASLSFINISEPNGVRTEIGEAINELEKNYNPGELDSVILLSDGANNGLILTKPSDEFLKNISFQINTVSAGLDNNPRDIWIDNVKASEVAFVRHPLSVDVAIKSIGFKAFSLPVTLKEEDKIVSTQEISINPDTNNKVEFTLSPTSLGKKIYTVSIPVIAGETTKENNQKSFAVDVVIDKIRVLHVAGSPSWDVRFLRRALKRNPNVDLVSFFILREASDMVFASQDELSLIPFPVDELFGNELGSFDAIILQNFDFRPYGIYSYHLERLKEYVIDEGGSFLMIGGDNSFNSGSYGGTPISEILPVELSPIPPRIDETFSTERFHAKLTPIGIHHPVMRVTSNGKENEENWKQMPELDGFNKVEGLKPNALPLITTPQGEPILVLSQVKSGRVASFLSDSLWEWNFVRAGKGTGTPYYETLWNRMLLWLVNDPELKDIRVRTEKTYYDPGEKAKLDIWKFAYGNKEEEVKAYVIYPDGIQKELNLENASLDRFTAEIETDKYGVYKVKVETKTDDSNLLTDSGSDETAFLIEPPMNEINSPNIDNNLLKKLSEKTSGRFITVDENPQELKIDFSPKKIISGYRTEQMWDKAWFLISILALLSSEWILGRKWGLR
ncbi:MAG TPA: glutamine amidotransferase [Thermodesulfobacteriota bacterium]